MKKVSLLFVCFALACAGADAQSLLERLGERAKNAAENNVGNKVEQGVNDLLNGKLGKKKDKKNQKQETPAQTAAVDGTWTCQNPECGHAGNTGNFCTECGTRKPAGETAAQNTQQKKTVQTAYAKSDFVPGDEVIYDDPMDDEQLGEFPSRLELLAGESEVLEINGKKCFALSHHGDRVSPLMKNPRNFLGDVFTVEFDAFQTGEEEGRLVWEFFPADMDKDPSLKFEVQGHCDNTGSDKGNDPLSQKRAEAIVARLVEMGISADRLTAVGKGSHEPIADNGTDEGRAKNRRVEFVKK